MDANTNDAKAGTTTGTASLRPQVWPTLWARDARGSDQESPWSLPPGGFGAYVVTAEPDALFGRATGAGATVVAGLHDTDYGSRDFTVRDPEGNLWAFGTYPGAPRKPG
ncbi:MAG TPA: VOC family protein [Streptosporangiaceae bacterium]|jgi:uncharacterized glyoxalase superfamily protein PhnB